MRRGSFGVWEKCNLLSGERKVAVEELQMVLKFGGPQKKKAPRKLGKDDEARAQTSLFLVPQTDSRPETWWARRS